MPENFWLELLNRLPDCFSNGLRVFFCAAVDAGSSQTPPPASISNTLTFGYVLLLDVTLELLSPSAPGSHCPFRKIIFPFARLFSMRTPSSWGLAASVTSPIAIQVIIPRSVPPIFERTTVRVATSGFCSFKTT